MDGADFPRDEKLHWPENQGEQVSSDVTKPIIDPLTNSARSRRGAVAASSASPRILCRDNIDGVDIFGTLSAHIDDPR